MKKSKATVDEDKFLVTFDEQVSSVLADSLFDNTETIAPPPEVLKIFYCSRTHSQISQFVREIRKTSFNVSLVSLGSRANLCINEDVVGLKGIDKMNDACLDMQQGKCKACPYLQKEEKGKRDFQVFVYFSCKGAFDG
jgi:hypothetical protein